MATFVKFLLVELRGGENPPDLITYHIWSNHGCSPHCSPANTNQCWFSYGALKSPNISIAYEIMVLVEYVVAFYSVCCQ